VLHKPLAAASVRGFQTFRCCRSAANASLSPFSDAWTTASTNSDLLGSFGEGRLRGVGPSLARRSAGDAFGSRCAGKLPDLDAPNLLSDSMLPRSLSAHAVVEAHTQTLNLLRNRLGA
jgi:hypothetical protein